MKVKDGIFWRLLFGLILSACVFFIKEWAWQNFLFKAQYENGIQKEYVVYDELRRSYIFHLPKNDNFFENESVPLFFVLHGASGNADQIMENTGMNKIADKENFIVVYPNGTGLFSEYVLSWNAGQCCNFIEPLQDDSTDLKISEKELEEIKELAKSPNIIHLIAQNIATSIYGHDKVKEALVLQLAGGCRKVRPDGVITRGDMHMLLIGDPGSGKSQLLKRLSKVAPKARFVSGKGATGAGLTASVVKDEFLGGWSLEAGTLVLANKGLQLLTRWTKCLKKTDLLYTKH